METWPMTEARQMLPSLVERARAGAWQLVGRRGRPEAVIAGASDLEEVLALAYRFHPEVILGEGAAEVWLPELETHADAATLDEALTELADVMVEYAEDWQDHLRIAANHRPRAGFVRRIQIAGDASGVLAMLDRDADVEGASDAVGGP
jgi:prevent-host-death family protein